MPRGDGTGPMREVQTERPSQGDFIEAPQEDFPDAVRGFGWRGGRGRGQDGGARGRGAGQRRDLCFGAANSYSGRGFGCAGRTPAKISPNQEIAVLQERAKYLRQTQEEIARRIEELQAVSKS